MKSVGVIGEGAWGTAISSVLADNGCEVALWCHDAAVAVQINNEHRNDRYMPGFVLSDYIVAHEDLSLVLDNDLIFISTPMKYFRNVVEQCKKYYRSEQQWVVLSKGIENDTLLLPSQILMELLSSQIKCSVLGGPSFAQEVMGKKLTGVNIAAIQQSFTTELVQIIQNNYFRTFPINDLIGIQTGGALKNVLAFLMGMVDGLGYSDDTRALFFTHGWQEMLVVAQSLGAQQETLLGLAGIGDVFLTVTGRYSRNVLVGKAFGEGKSLDHILKETGYIPEGINTIKTVEQIIQKNRLTLPLFDALYNIVYNGTAPKELVLVIAR